jgi:hypothetical protein
MSSNDSARRLAIVRARAKLGSTVGRAGPGSNVVSKSSGGLVMGVEALGEEDSRVLVSLSLSAASLCLRMCMCLCHMYVCIHV